MKSALHSVMSFGVLVFCAAGAQAHSPNPGSGAAMLARETLVIRAHGVHTDCRYGPMYAKEDVQGMELKPAWHKHIGRGWTAKVASNCPAPKGWVPPGKGKIDKAKPVVAPSCATKPRASSNCPSYSAEWTCANWHAPLKCCTRWRCTSKIR